MGYITLGIEEYYNHHAQIFVSWTHNNTIIQYIIKYDFIEENIIYEYSTKDVLDAEKKFIITMHFDSYFVEFKSTHTLEPPHEPQSILEQEVEWV